MQLKINLERNQYYTGKRIDKEDLLLEQNYFIDKVKTINKMLVGYGIISGLEIHEFKNANKTVTINKGIGIDNHGNFITLLNQKTFSFTEKLLHGDYIYLKYIDTNTDRQEIGDNETCSENCTFNHFLDDTEIFISKEFLVPNTRNVCTKKDAPRNDVDIKEALLYLGQYKVVNLNHSPTSVSGKNGIIDKSKRRYIYTNNEIFKLLCNINQNHVSSVNGQNGDLSLVSSISDVIPDENGLINLVAGNNIKIESDDNEIKISTKGGFHKEYYFSLAKKGSASDDQIIEHNRASFPIVDVYKRVINTDNRTRVVTQKELRAEARDLGVNFESYNKENNVVAFNEKIDNTVNKSLTVNSALKKINVSEVSSKVLKISEAKLDYYINDLYIVPLFSYKKIVGDKDNINIEISHLNNNSVKVKNLSTTSADILVILST